MYEARGTEKLLHTPLRRNNEFTYTKIESVPFKKPILSKTDKLLGSTETDMQGMFSLICRLTFAKRASSQSTKLHRKRSTGFHPFDLRTIDRTVGKTPTNELTLDRTRNPAVKASHPAPPAPFLWFVRARCIGCSYLSRDFDAYRMERTAIRYARHTFNCYSSALIPGLAIFERFLRVIHGSSFKEDCMRRRKNIWALCATFL